MRTPAGRQRLVRQRTLELGFPFMGIAPSGPAPHGKAFDRWLDAGHGGEMAWLRRGRPTRVDPRTRFPWLRTVLTVGLPYAGTRPAPGEGPDRGRLPPLISRYAQGDDYHLLMERRLKALAEFCRAECGAGNARYYVDTGPVLERDWSDAAGLGFQGKNAMVIVPGAGSWLFLGEVLLDVEIEPPTRPPRGCGDCRLCIDACPTGAIVPREDGSDSAGEDRGPHFVDARRCLSYLNIELRGAVPADLRPALGANLFGCDVCQEVCPYNKTKTLVSALHPGGPGDSEEHGVETTARRVRKAAPGGTPAPVLPELGVRAAYEGLHADELIELGEGAFRDLFRRSAVRRARREGIRRNAMIVSANLKLPAAAAPLRRSLDDPDPVLRATAAWALSRLGLPESRRALENALARESDPAARAELAAALE